MKVHNIDAQSVKSYLVTDCLWSSYGASELDVRVPYMERSPIHR